MRGVTGVMRPCRGPGGKRAVRGRGRREKAGREGRAAQARVLELAHGNGARCHCVRRRRRCHRRRRRERKGTGRDKGGGQHYRCAWIGRHGALTETRRGFTSEEGRKLTRWTVGEIRKTGGSGSVQTRFGSAVHLARDKSVRPHAEPMIRTTARALVSVSSAPLIGRIYAYSTQRHFFSFFNSAHSAPL